MTEKEIVEGNKLIIESPFVKDVQRQWMLKAKEAAEEFYTTNLLPKLEYHLSWDWQIPVWRKVNLAVKQVISDLLDKKPGLYHTSEKFFLTQICDAYNDAVFQNDTLKGQQIIVEAIKWYNTQPKP